MIDCIYYAYKLLRRERRRNSNGSYSTHWRTLDSSSNRTPFFIKDSTGVVKIDPMDAEIDAPKILEQYVEPTANMNDGALRLLLVLPQCSVGISKR